MRSAAYERFLESMHIGYEQWHDGTPYDLDALSIVTPEERQEIENLLIPKKDDDWRVSEALASINSPRSLHALQESTSGPNREVRLRAGELLYELGVLDSIDNVIIEGLKEGELGQGLAQAERLAAKYPSPAIIDALLRGALCAKDGRAVRFAGLLFFLHGKASGPFDWQQRPFFLRFNTPDQRERQNVFDEMCQKIGVDGSRVRCA